MDCFDVSSSAIMIGGCMASSKLLYYRDMGAANNSLLELAYKLRQAEFRVYNVPVIDEASVQGETPQHFNLARETTAETLRNAALELSCLYTTGSGSVLPGLDFSSDQMSADASLKSIQDRYRLFRASFPRSIETETTNLADNCFLATNVIAFHESNGKTANPSQRVFSSETTAAVPSIEQHKRYSCNFCDYQTDNRSHSLLHLKSIHCNESRDRMSQPEMTTKKTLSDAMRSGAVRRRVRGGMSAKRFKCDMCIYSTDCLSHLRRHQGCVHNKMMSYWCYICKKEFSRSEKTKAHFLAFHPNVPYDPKKIRKLSPQKSSKSVADKEMLLEVEQETKVEDDSLYSSTGVSDLKKTFENIENQNIKVCGKGRERQYSCPKCNYVSHGQWHMKRHMMDVHETVKEFSCKVCCYAASRQHRIISHMRTHGEMFCLFCDYSNADLEIFKRHFSLCNALHRVETVARCHVCQLECSDPKQLRLHINETHSVILHSCDLCPYYTDIPDEIYSHSRLHVENDLVCKVCNLSFVSDDQLSIHFKSKHVTQLSNSSYSCTACGHKETEFSEIVSHVQHHETKVFSCGHNLCNFKCMLENSCHLHWQYHHGIKPATLFDGGVPATEKSDD